MDSFEFLEIKREITDLLSRNDDAEDSLESPHVGFDNGTVSDFDECLWLEAYPDTANSPELGEIDRFAVTPVADRKCDILEWWVSRQTEFPKLSKLALDYLAIPASSVPAERANSAAERAFDGRSSLTSSAFRAEICCRSWIEFLRSKKIHIPDDFRKEFRAMDSQDLADIADNDDVVAYLLGNEVNSDDDSDFEALQI